MRKAILKRFKITKKGKFLRRASGQNHFNAKASRQSQLHKKKFYRVSAVLEKKLKNYL